MNIPNLKANVDLLIGTNAHRILEPWEVINSSGNGPYAIKTVLGWVVNGPLNGNSGASEEELPLAMMNRISTIRETSKPSQWRHVGSKDNPADDASRGMKVSDFLNNRRWLGGPTLLWKREQDWPRTVLDVSVDSDDQEVRKEVFLVLQTSSLPTFRTGGDSRQRLPGS